MEESERIFRLPFEFNDTDRLGPWDILLSEDAVKDVRRLESIDTVELVMKLLKQISSGAWDKYKLCQPPSQSYIIRTKNPPTIYEVVHPGSTDSNSLRILWNIDYEFSIRCYSLTQLVKVWAITSNHEQIQKVLGNLETVHDVYTAEHHSKCTALKGRNNLFLPMQFGDGGIDNVVLSRKFEDTESTIFKNEDNEDFGIDDDKMLEVHKMLVTNKFFPISKNLFWSLVLDGSDFTFQVSKVEYEIINNPTSAIVVGRSGTGKTTCIVFRQLASYLANQLYKMPSQHDNDENFYKRQIFITVSYNLCSRVKEHFNQLKKSAMLTGVKMSRDELCEFYDEMVKKRKEDDENNEAIDNNMREEEDEKEELKKIPNSFRSLEDHHFPLFITYEKFSEMLMGTFGINTKKLTVQKEHNAEDEESSDNSWEHFVNYDLFKEKYWRHFSDEYRKKLNCELVYSEFSVIKGTNPEVNYLSREEYRDVSIKKYPVFCYNRDEIYDLFERYEKMKGSNGDYDSVDRTLAISHAAETRMLGGPQIHEVYIDECQDNQIIDFALILKLFNQADSIFTAGDIAQCIARGSSFRFQDLRALMHQWEIDRNNRDQQDTINKFELNVNYRSHNGILQLASSVVDLLKKLFPDSIDQLLPERGMVNGPQPIIFKGFQPDTFFSDVFFGSEKVTNLIEFGASQVIIVRNDKAKQRLKELNNDTEDIGLVLTVFEAKGMEFNDVLLYNFFTDSPALLKWRVILSTLNDYSKGIQTFSHEKHYILSSELKHLYVAVTRAREHLWIFDENAELSEPIQTYWKSKKLVKVIESMKEINSFSTLAKKSSPSEWNKEGKKFFEQRKYEQAITCFRKSGNEFGYKLAQAYHLRNIARISSVNGSDEKIVKLNFIAAAKAFDKCSRPIQAASCYEDNRMYKEAGDCYVKWKMYEHATQCYQKAKMWNEAGKLFEKLEKYTDAVIAYKNGGHYKKVIDLIQSYGQKIDKKTSRRTILFINIFYRRESNKEMSERALCLFTTKEEKIEFLKDHSPDELLDLYVKNNQFRDAAKHLQSRGRFEEAAYMFIHSVSNDEDIIESLNCFLHLCRINLLKNAIADITNQSTSELDNLILKATRTKFVTNIRSKSSKSLKKTDEWKSLMKEVELYFAYYNKNLNRVNEYIQFFKNCKEFVTEFYAICVWLQIFPQPQINAEYWLNRLQYLLRICKIAFPYIYVVNKLRNSVIDTKKIRKDFEDIFCIIKVDGRQQKRKIYFKNPLVNHSNIGDALEIMGNWHIYNVHDVHKAISQFLVEYTFKCIMRAGQHGRDVPHIGYNICHRFTHCQKPNCQSHHVAPTPLILYQRLKLTCLQYTVMRQLDILYHRRLLKEEQSTQVLGAQRWWAERLVKNIRYQSPQMSCPEITNMVLDELPKQTRVEFINFAYKIWLPDITNRVNNFEVMLKCMFVFQQLRHIHGINNFYSRVKKENSHLDNLQIGKLSLFLSSLYSKEMIPAITNAREFINYAINNANQVNLKTYEAFGDLVSLMEFTTSLVFANGSKDFNFYLPRAYLVNYFDAYTVKPLIPDHQHDYSRKEYTHELEKSFSQIEQLIKQLINNGPLTIILRLVRLLILIGLNESTIMLKVTKFFEHLNKKVYSKKIKDYLEAKPFNLKKFLHNDLKETGCDSLVFVQYHQGVMSKISNLENGIVKLTYNSIEGFRSALQQIISPIAIEKKSTTTTTVSTALGEKLPLQKVENNEQNTNPMATNNDDNEDENSDQFSTSENTQESEIDITWFNKIFESSTAREAAKKIKTWFRRAQYQKKSRQLGRDSTLDKIYNDIRDFCQDVSYWEIVIDQKGKAMVRKYSMILKGPMVDIILELTKLQNKLDKIENKLQKIISNKSTDEEELESCLELKDDLKCIYNENIKTALELLSVSENSVEHKEANIEWLENRLQQANSTIDDVNEWIVNSELDHL